MRSLIPLLFCLISAGVVQLQAYALAAPELGNFSSTAILGWYAWHTASKTIPGLVRSFREELAAERRQRQAHHEALAAMLAELRDRLSARSKGGV